MTVLAGYTERNWFWHIVIIRIFFNLWKSCAVIVWGVTAHIWIRCGLVSLENLTLATFSKAYRLLIAKNFLSYLLNRSWIVNWLCVYCLQMLIFSSRLQHNVFTIKDVTSCKYLYKVYKRFFCVYTAVCNTYLDRWW